jgi:hypothetical protein
VIINQIKANSFRGAHGVFRGAWFFYGSMAPEKRKSGKRKVEDRKRGVWVRFAQGNM